MNSKKHPFIFIFNILIFSFIILLYYTDSAGIKISTASALLILPVLTAFSLFHSPLASGLTGVIVGIFMDACAPSSYCFNATVLMLIAVFVAVASNTLFNKNIPSAAVLSLITSVFYFVYQWIVFHAAVESLNNSLIYLLNYALPSAVFSAIFIFPFYFLYKKFHKISLE